MANLSDWLSQLTAEQAALREFVQLLQSEQSTLVSIDTDQLLFFSDQKSGLIARLATMARQRRELQAALGFGGEVEHWLKANLPAALNGWHELQQLAREAQELNRVNGELIQVRLRHTQQALTALTAASNSASLYGADGQTHHVGGGRILGAA